MPQSHLLLSPNGQLDAAQETASNHSGHSSSNNNNNNNNYQDNHPEINNHHHQEPPAAFSTSSASSMAATSTTSTTPAPTNNNKKKNFNSEYKSKFKPFSEYAYDEGTDSFVKCHSGAECPIGASRSNQDLRGASGSLVTTGDAQISHLITISTHNAAVFEPSHDGSEAHAGAGGSVAEPWYKEVVKRNEKANEYRFKSEVGHHSPLLNYNTRSDSPSIQQFTSNDTPTRLTSPSGYESIVGGKGGASSTIGGDSNTNIETRSQHSDHQLNNDAHEQLQAAKVQYRFTPSSYKRDNLIAHMANNNNFNLPKEQQAAASNSQQPRRPVTSSSQARARSQSSRRPPNSSINTSSSGAHNSALASSKVQASSKSNHTTPTKNVTATATRTNFTMRPTNASTSKSHSKTPQAAASMPASRYATTSRTQTSANGSGGSASKRSPSASTSTSTPTAASRSTPKPTFNSSSKTTPMSASSSVKKTAVTPTITAKPTLTARPKTAAPSRPLAGSKTSDQSPTKTSSIKAGKLPVTNARAPSGTRTASSRDKSVLSKTPETNTVKSIKTRKAIESETAKVAAAAAAVAATAAGVAIAAGDLASAASSEEPLKDIPKQQQATGLVESATIQPMRYVPEEQNLIFTTTEAGDMLADELAQAELAQQAEIAVSRYEQQQTETSNQKRPDEDKSQRDAFTDDISKQLTDVSQSGELVNGLAGGLVSAEDRFDSSERDFSIDANEAANQLMQQEQEQNYNDEPYSIIPTATDLDKEDNKRPVESSLDEGGPGATFEILAGATDESKNVMLLPDITQKISEVNLSDTNGDDDDEEHPKLGNDETIESYESRLISDPTSQPKPDDEDDYTKKQLKDQHRVVESDSDLMGYDGHVGTDALVSSSSAAMEPSQLFETPTTTTPLAEITPQIDSTSQFGELNDQPDSTIPTPTNIVEDLKLDDTNYDQDDHYDIREATVRDTGNMREVPSGDNDETEREIHQERAGDISTDERLELSHNLTTSSDDGLILNAVNLDARAEDNSRPQELSHNLTTNSSDDGLILNAATLDAGAKNNSRPQELADQSDLDLMAQENTTGAVVHSVDGFEARSEWLRESYQNREERISLKSTEDENEPDSTNLKKTEVIDEDGQQRLDFVRGNRDDTNMAGEIDGIVVDFATDNKELMPDVTQKIYQINLDDDIDNDEHLKLSNNLTNSDDELILKPGNLKSVDGDDLTTPTSQQQQLEPESRSVPKKESHSIAESEEEADSEVRISSEASQLIHSFDMQPRESVNVPGSIISTADMMSTFLDATTRSAFELNPENDDVTCKLVPGLVKCSDVYIDKPQTNLVDVGSENFNNDRKNSPSDGLILNPGNLSQDTNDEFDELAGQIQKANEQQQSDLDLMAQEDRLEGTLELGDGSSAALGTIPTSIENRVEMSTSKSQTDEPDMLQANFKFARKISEDSDEELDIDPDEDPIGSAATLSPNTSVAEELMRFNAVKDNLDLDLNRQSATTMSDDEKYMTDLTSDSMMMNDHIIGRNNNGSTKEDSSKIEPVSVTSHVIGETIKQLSEQK